MWIFFFRLKQLFSKKSLFSVIFFWGSSLIYCYPLSSYGPRAGTGGLGSPISAFISCNKKSKSCLVQNTYFTTKTSLPKYLHQLPKKPNFNYACSFSRFWIPHEKRGKYSAHSRETRKIQGISKLPIFAKS